jgi:hypothetical protein
MGLRADHAWRTAAQCARLARDADTESERAYFVRMRDTWITIANDCEFLDSPAEGAASDGLAHVEGPPAGPFMPFGLRGR